MTFELENSFEADLREALLDDVEQRAREKIAPEVQEYAHDVLEQYGQRHEYNVSTLIEAGQTRVERREGRVFVRWGWPEPAIYFERGTADHVVQTRNADVLSFVWEERHDPPQWVREEFDREGDGWRVFLPETNVDGLPESRFIRDSLNYVRRQFES
ncbi:hypothetical protein C482_15341 [Natrialba chahannaoensis JCM 10990]|uniref:HK97 gp10 family phage protein n=1 Tax=Natrialba chahannaoensis JCM 10990 TaxID=1227492 RepID=M0AED1_9EURY|nr:hypothetical protein [Natrialba chahannaoensis]ELY96761.1 hypothetical protein C482_15341 [Natrialba chahannaoensis JCM 10990]